MAELIELKCPNCGGQMEWAGGPAQVVCPHCGTQFLVPSEVAEYLACPKCGKVDRVQKVSAAYRAGLSVLAPPKEPTVRIGCEEYLVQALFFFGGIAIFYASIWLLNVVSGLATWLLGAGGLALLWLVLLVWVSRRRHAHRVRRLAVEKQRWDGAILRWEHLYYCARDDGVFVPGETSLIPIDQLHTYLYAD